MIGVDERVRQCLSQGLVHGSVVNSLSSFGLKGNLKSIASLVG